MFELPVYDESSKSREPSDHIQSPIALPIDIDSLLFPNWLFIIHPFRISFQR
jgi:hypothetical protein